MNQAARFPYGEEQDIICDCGVTLKVRFTKQDGHNDHEEFNCPNCKSNHKVMASMPIQDRDVRIIPAPTMFLQISGRLSRLAQLFDNLRVAHEQAEMDGESRGPDEDDLEREIDIVTDEIKKLMESDPELKELHFTYFRSLIPSMRQAVRNNSARYVFPYRDAFKAAPSLERLKELLAVIPVS